MSGHVTEAEPRSNSAAHAAGIVLACVVVGMGLLGAALGAAVARSTTMFCRGDEQQFCEAQDYLVPAAVGGAVAVLVVMVVLNWWRPEVVVAAMANAGFVFVLAGLGDVVAGLTLAVFVAWVPGSAVTAVTAVALVAGTGSSFVARRGAATVALALGGCMVVTVVLAIVLEVAAWPLAPAAALWIATVAGGLGGRTAGLDSP